MVMRQRASLIWLFAAGAAVCAAQQDQRTAAVQLADHYAAVYQVPRELVHSIIEVESGWHPRAVSSKGAVGLMQLMPATAATFGVTNRFEIDQNIRGGVAYLARLLKLFSGDLRLVAAAYLTGEAQILRAGLKYSNAEVYRYVVKVARLYSEKRLKRLKLRPSRQTRCKEVVSYDGHKVGVLHCPHTRIRGTGAWTSSSADSGPTAGRRPFNSRRPSDDSVFGAALRNGDSDAGAD
jgi:hypothetical protein